MNAIIYNIWHYIYLGSGCSCWVDFTQANVLVSFHSLKTMDLGPLRGLGPLFSRNGAILGHSPIRNELLYSPQNIMHCVEVGHITGKITHRRTDQSLKY